MPTITVLGLMVIVSFVVVAGTRELWELRWEPLPDPLRRWLIRHVGPRRFRVWIVDPPTAAQRWARWTARYVMSHPAMSQSDATSTIATATTLQQPIPIVQNDSNALLQAKAEALAALILAKKVTQTEGIRIVFGLTPSSSSRRYQEAVAAVKTAIDARRAIERPLTDEQKAFRASAGLPV